MVNIYGLMEINILAPLRMIKEMDMVSCSSKTCFEEKFLQIYT